MDVMKDTEVESVQGTKNCLAITSAHAKVHRTSKLHFQAGSSPTPYFFGTTLFPEGHHAYL